MPADHAARSPDAALVRIRIVGQKAHLELNPDEADDGGIQRREIAALERAADALELMERARMADPIAVWTGQSEGRQRAWAGLAIGDMEHALVAVDGTPADARHALALRLIRTAADLMEGA